MLHAVKTCAGNNRSMHGYLVAACKDALSSALDQQDICLFSGVLSGGGSAVTPLPTDNAHGLAVAVKFQGGQLVQSAKASCPGPFAKGTFLSLVSRWKSAQELS